MRPDLLRARAKILRAVRDRLHGWGYLEVHTPVLVPTAAIEEHLEAVPAGGAWLHTSPELAMKRVVAAGLPRIYQIAPCFREEELGCHHRREFTLLEWYRVGAGTEELIDEVQELVGVAAGAIGEPPPPFTIRSAAKLLTEPDPLRWFHQWVDRIEPTLNGAVIVRDYPAWQAALARIRGEVADRFELYLGGLELANAFAEETDGAEIRERQAAANAARIRAGRAPHPVDEAFLAALDRMPRCAGIALGIDRLVMALTGAPDIGLVQVGRDDVRG